MTYNGIRLTMAFAIAWLTPAFADAVLAWNPNPASENVTHYDVKMSINGGAWSSSRVVGTNFQFSATGTNRYQLQVVAINSSLLESDPSDIVTFVPTQFPAPPAVHITGRTILSYNRLANVWVKYKVVWNPIDLATYGATNYVLSAQASAAGNVSTISTGTNSFHEFAGLPVDDYIFSVSVTGPGGISPAGAQLYQSSKPPKKPDGVLFRP